MEHDSNDPRLPDPLIGELSRLYRRDAGVPAEVDRTIVNRARAHLAGRGRPRLLLRTAGVAAAVAAAVLAVAVLVHRPSRQVAAVAGDVNHDGVVDIRDALALQQTLNRGVVEGHDINHDGVTDRRDVDAIAMLAVRLDRAGAVR